MSDVILWLLYRVVIPFLVGALIGHVAVRLYYVTGIWRALKRVRRS